MLNLSIYFINQINKSFSKKYSFAEVIEEEKRLTNEIRNIDVQMQKMVYENYSNFIETNKLLTGVILFFF